LRLFENKVPKGILRPKREIMKYWRKKDGDDRLNLYLYLIFMDVCVYVTCA